MQVFFYFFSLLFYKKIILFFVQLAQSAEPGFLLYHFTVLKRRASALYRAKAGASRGSG